MKLLTAAVAVMTTFGLAACTGGSGGTPVEPSENSASESETNSAEATDQADNADQAEGGSSGDTHKFTQAALKAIDLAEAETGGLVYAIDAENEDRWEIDVNANGNEIEVDVSWDGTKVLSSNKDGKVDTDTLGELKQAKLTIQDAIHASVPHANGYLDEAEIDTENGVVVWEVSFEDSGTEWAIDIDVSTGEILDVEQD